MTRPLPRQIAQWCFDFILWLLDGDAKSPDVRDDNGITDDSSSQSPLVQSPLVQSGDNISPTERPALSAARPTRSGLPDARMLMGVVEAEMDLDRPVNDYPLFFRVGPLHVHSSKEEE